MEKVIRCRELSISGSMLLSNNKYLEMKTINIIIAISCCVLIASCKKDFLDNTKPEDKISGADVWQSPELAMKVINGAYQALPAGHTWFMMMSATDEGYFAFNDLNAPYTYGLVTPDNLGFFDQSAWALAE